VAAFAAIGQFSGLGAVLYMAAGAALLGGSPLYAPAAIFYGNPAAFNYDIMRNSPLDGTAGPISFITKGYPKHPPAPTPGSNGTNGTNSTNGTVTFRRRERALLTKLQLSEGNTVRMFNMGKPYEQKHVPEDMKMAGKMLEGLGAIFKAKNAHRQLGGAAVAIPTVDINFREGTRTPRAGPNFYMGESIDSCTVCNMDPAQLAGPGKDQCSCDADSAESNELGQEEVAIPYSPYYIYPMTKIQVCGDKADAPSLTTAIQARDALYEIFDDPAYKVAVATADPYRVARKLMSPEEHRALAASNKAGCETYNLHMVISDSAKAADFVKQMTETPEEFASQLIDVLDLMSINSPTADATITDVSFNFNAKNMIYIPAYNTKEFQQFAGFTTGFASAGVVSVEKDNVAVNSVAQGGQYEVQLNGFPGNRTFVCKLIGSKNVTVGGKTKFVQTTQTLKVTNTRRSTSPAFPWRVRKNQAISNDYYIMCTDLKPPRQSYYSNAIAVTAAPRLRKLGPSAYWHY
jgi:hypothetical protein